MMPGMNPKQLEKLMSQMGIRSSSIDAKRVVIEREGESIIIEPAEIVAIEMQGRRSYQISGAERIESAVSEEDIRLVVEQTGAGEEDARKALLRHSGDIAQAILELRDRPEKQK